MTLGEILQRLTDPETAEALVTAVARPEIQERIVRAASDAGVSTGALVASRLRRAIEHGGEELWLNLLSAMAASPRPGAIAVERLLAQSFPQKRAC